MMRILLIDDSDFQNAWMDGMLVCAGHETIVATSAAEARSAAGQGIDACLVELLLLQENGFELAGMDELSGVPLVLMLARYLESDLAWADALGIRHFLYRPCTQSTLEQLLLDLFAQHPAGERPG